MFFEQLGDSPVFAQETDGILFRQGADSLKTVYPDSRYVKALDREAERRMRILEVVNQVRNAPESNFPDIKLPDTKGEKRALSEVDAKVIMVHFWDEGDAAQKMMSLDTLLPIYEKYHPRGFEIYSVCVSVDKPEWASSVLGQKLPWINVCGRDVQHHGASDLVPDCERGDQHHAHQRLRRAPEGAREAAALVVSQIDFSNSRQAASSAASCVLRASRESMLRMGRSQRRKRISRSRP